MPLPGGLADPQSHSDLRFNADLLTSTPSPESLYPRRAETTSATEAMQLAVDFESLRPRLFGIAQRILGRAADAEDVVQDVWIRWDRIDRAGVRDSTAFLVTTTTRVALTVATSARMRRELPIGEGIAGAVSTPGDPAADAERAEELDLAVVFLLARLSPLECAVFVLREAFDYPFRAIADTLGLSEPNARQLARRARARLTGGPCRPVNPREFRRLHDAIRNAAVGGEITRLEQVLTETVGRQQAA